MGFNLIRKTAPIAPEDRRPAKTERNQMIMVARSAYDKWRHSFYSCAERTAASALRKRGKKNGRRMRRRKRGRELVRVAFQAQADGRSPTFSPGGHFWRHLLVTKGGKPAPRKKCRIEDRDTSRVNQVVRSAIPKSEACQIHFKDSLFGQNPKSGSPQPPHAEGCIVPPQAADASSAGRGLTKKNRTLTAP